MVHTNSNLDLKTTIETNLTMLNYLGVKLD